MWCVLVLLPRAGRPPRTPRGLAARSGRRGGGLLRAFELRNAGRVEVFVFVWQQTLWTDGLEYYHVLQQRDPSGMGVVQNTVLLLLHSGRYSLIHRRWPADKG